MNDNPQDIDPKEWQWISAKEDDKEPLPPVTAVHGRCCIIPDYRTARGVLKGITDDEPAEVAIGRLRDNS